MKQLQSSMTVLTFFLQTDNYEQFGFALLSPIIVKIYNEIKIIKLPKACFMLHQSN